MGIRSIVAAIVALLKPHRETAMARTVHKLDDVFVAGGQPSLTYVQRTDVDVEPILAKAIATPNQLVSLSGPTKCGKTVLCRHVLRDREFIWIEGGQVANAEVLWNKVAYKLNKPREVTKTASTDSSGTIGAEALLKAEAAHSRSSGTERRFELDPMHTAIDHLVTNKVTLVVDDFHYLPQEARQAFLQNVKGAIFEGLKIVLLAVAHRGQDPIKTQIELVGRFANIAVPPWTPNDLRAIPEIGFGLLNVSCPEELLRRLADEAQQSPFLMQTFCREICSDLNVQETRLAPLGVPHDYPLAALFERIAKHSGQPTYEKLVAGPQARKQRKARPLHSGDAADVYEATLRAVAATGPASPLAFETLRTSLNKLVKEKVPATHEVTSALKNLAKISKQMGVDQGIDWDDDSRTLTIADPYLRFYLQWMVRRERDEAPALRLEP